MLLVGIQGRKKYFTIPEEFIDYNPILPDDLEKEAQPIVYSSDDESMIVGDIEKNAKEKEDTKVQNKATRSTKLLQMQRTRRKTRWGGHQRQLLQMEDFLAFYNF